MKIIFMGTPEFAVPSLIKIHESPHQIVSVVTQPDRQKGRGRKTIAPAVKNAALQFNIPVLQPESLKNPDFINQLHDLNADCYVVVAFRILPPEVFQIPLKGTINLHASLLPKYRGAAPIQWALLRGEKETGVTTFFIEKRVDVGDLIFQEKISINTQDNYGSLHDTLANAGSDLLLKTMDAISNGSVQSKPQIGTPTPASKIFPDQTKIIWSDTAENIHNKIRAFSPRPGAFTVWQGQRVKIFVSEIMEEHHISGNKPPGTILNNQKTLFVRTGNGVLSITDLQLQGKKRLPVESFLPGIHIPQDSRFE